MPDIRIGSLYHTYDPRGLQEASAALRKYAQDAKQSTANTGVGDSMRRDATAASEAQKQITALGSTFERLQGQGRTGRVGADDLAQGMRDLQADLRKVAGDFTLTSSETKQIGSIFQATGREIVAAEKQILGSMDKVTIAAKDQVPPWVKLKDAVYNARSAYEADKIELGTLLTVMGELQKQALADAEAIDQETRATKAGRAAYKAYMDSAGAASRYMATAEGRASKLGLSANIAAASTNALSMGFMRLGPAGMVAGSALETAGLGAVAAGAGIVGLGYASYQLLQRGIPQIGQMQQAVQLLTASGQAMTQSDLADTLRNIQQEAGKAGEQFNRADLATALSEIVKAGLPAAQALDLLAPGMQLASVTGQNLNDTTGLLLQNLRQFGLDSSNAQRAANDLAQADLLSASSAQALSEGLASVGPVAAQSGLSLEQTLGILTELSNKGLDPATVGGNSLRVVMTSLLKPSAQAREALKTLGVETRDAAGHQRDMMSILTDMRKALKTYGISVDESTGKVVGQYDATTEAARVFRTRGITAILAMGDATDTLTQKIENSQGALKNYADTMLSDNIVAAQNALKKAIDDLSASFTVTFIPAITASIQALTDFINKLDAFLHPNAQADAMTKSFLNQSGDSRLAAIMEVYQKDLLQRAALNRTLQGLQERAANVHLQSQKNAIQHAIDLTQEQLAKIEARVKGDEAALNRRQQQLKDQQATDNANGNAGAGGDGSAAIQPVTTLIDEAKKLVIALNTATKGSSVQALLQAQGELDKWANTGDATESALRKSIIQAVRTVVGNSAKAAGKTLDTAAAEQASQALVDGMVRWAKLSLSGSVSGFQSAMQQGESGAVQSAAAVKAYNAEVTATADAATKAVGILENQRQAIIASARFRQGGVSAGGPPYLTGNGQSSDEASLFGKYNVPTVGPNATVAAWATQDRQTMLAASGRLQGGAGRVPVEQVRAIEAANKAARDYTNSMEAMARTLDAMSATTDQLAQSARLAAEHEALLAANQAGLLQGGPQGNVASTGPIAPGTFTASRSAAMAAGMLQGGGGQSTFTMAQAATDQSIATFTDTLNRLSQAGRETATFQKKAADDAAAKSLQAADQFAHTVISAGSSFVSAIEALQKGDVKGAATGFAQTAGSIVSLLPGAGPLVGSILQSAAPLIGEIAQGISDLFTGDSPAQRALRQSLSSTVAGAFSAGIMAGISGQQDWQTTLADNIKAGLLQALVQTFIQTAIMGAIMQPFIDQYVKILNSQGSDAAMNFLRNNAGAVIDTATKAAEGFVGGIPSDLLPSGGSSPSGSASGAPDTTGIYSVPGAATILAAPDWAPEMLSATKNLASAAQHIDSAATKFERAIGGGGAAFATQIGASA